MWTTTNDGCDVFAIEGQIVGMVVCRPSQSDKPCWYWSTPYHSGNANERTAKIRVEQSIAMNSNTSPN